MKPTIKKLFWGSSAAVAMLILLPVLSAFEAHVINVTAQIENGVLVVSHELEFGTTFPQEALDRSVAIRLSDSFQTEPIGTQCASSVAATAQGKRKNGTNVLPDRSDPTKALGLPQSTGAAFDTPVIANSFYSLGFDAGKLTLGFTNFIVNGPGNDITVYEVTGGPPYPDEKVLVEASQDNITYVVLGTLTKDASIDLGILPWAKYVRLTEASNKALFESTADGYDVDAVCATSRSQVGNLSYVLRQKPKCVDDHNASVHPQVIEVNGNFVCPAGSTMMPLLCPYLSKHETTTDGPPGENDSSGINSFHGLPPPWNLATTIATQQTGALSIGATDTADAWTINLHTPCFRGQCAQDWATFVHAQNPAANPNDYQADPVLEHQVFGCDLWFEVTGIQ